MVARSASLREWSRGVLRRAYRVAREEQASPVNGEQAAQRLLFAEYARRTRSGEPLPDLSYSGFRIFSQADEDGILLYLFSVLGMGSRICADFAYGSPHGANTTNLLCNWGWDGLLVESDPELVAAAEAFFRSHPGTCVYPPRVVNAWVTAENVNELFSRNGFDDAIDLLSIDLDGVDYWIWKALDIVQPRVVVVEFQDIWGPDTAVTVPYDPAFTAEGDYVGASLNAFVKLGRDKGYRLVGANHYGYNAFFVRNGQGDELLPEVSSASCLTHRKVRDGIRERLPAVKDRPWVEI
jgi:hypothetical protein